MDAKAFHTRTYTGGLRNGMEKEKVMCNAGSSAQEREKHVLE